MRSVLALGLFIAFCTSANAARVHHSKQRQVIVSPSRDVAPGFAVQGWTRAHHDEPPSYDDPSKRGGY